MKDHLSDLVLDALRLGTANAEAKTHLETCEICRGRSDELTKDAAAFEAKFNVAGLAAETLATADTGREAPWRRSWRWALLVPIAAAAALLLSPQPQTRTKGDSRPIELFVLEGDTPAAMRGPVAPDARLAVRVDAKRGSFVRLLWESTPNPPTALYPAEGADAWAVDEQTWLKNEIVLDGAPDDERLIAVVCTAAISHADALKAAEGVDERSDCEAHAIVVSKR